MNPKFMSLKERYELYQKVKILIWSTSSSYDEAREKIEQLAKELGI